MCAARVARKASYREAERFHTTAESANWAPACPSCHAWSPSTLFPLSLLSRLHHNINPGSDERLMYTWAPRGSSTCDVEKKRWGLASPPIRVEERVWNRRPLPSSDFLSFLLHSSPSFAPPFLAVLSHSLAFLLRDSHVSSPLRGRRFGRGEAPPRLSCHFRPDSAEPPGRPALHGASCQLQRYARHDSTFAKGDWGERGAAPTGMSRGLMTTRRDCTR